jgi:hypothetical protein
MQFIFLGTPECPDEIMLRDVVFPVNMTVEITDADFIAKLRRLPYFCYVNHEMNETKPRRGRPRKA